ncbi:hypothetical protein DFH09DRAFT_1183382 [Mycena vulgaris]|nr:hypothetical protein DFH09DRAFT_1183382 [Mycena vulgaris]
MSSSSSPFTYRFTPMPRPRSVNAPSFDGKNLSDFLDILLPHPIIVSYCTPERVVSYLPELQRDVRIWDDAVSELRDLYGSDDVVTYTIADLHDLCSRTCVGPPFRWLWDAEVYLRRFTPIAGYLRQLGFLTSSEVQVYFMAGLPFATRKEVEAQLPVANRGTDSPPTKRQVMDILRDLLRRDSFETFVTTRFFPTRSSLSPPSSDRPNPPVSQSRAESRPKSRSHRCFVCGGTGTHRLGPKFCPRTWELVERGLARFNPEGRLVSHDGSPLPMTRNPGGVAAHLIARLDRPRHCSQSIPHVASPSVVHDVPVPACNAPSNSNPPQSPIAVRRPSSPSLTPIPVASIPFDDSPSPSRSSLDPPHSSCPPRARTAPVVGSASNSPLSASNEIIESHPSLPSHAIPSSRHIPPLSKFKLNPPHPHHSISTPFPSSIHPSPHDSAPNFSDFGVDPKQLVKLSFADLLTISPPMRAKVAKFIRHLDSISISKPVRDLPSFPVTPSSTTIFVDYLRKSFINSLSPSSLFLVLITWTLSSYFSFTPKHLGSYGYLTDMISFLLSHATRLLMEYILI